jgi:predicted nucleic acid-binding protein
MRVALDSNILVYLSHVARTQADLPKIERSREILSLIHRRSTIVIATQALGELFNVLMRSGMTGSDARRVTLGFANSYTIVGSDRETMNAALDLAVDHHLQFWDSLIMTASADANSLLFLTEDLQDGFVMRGMTVANPFADHLQPALAELLTERLPE